MARSFSGTNNINHGSGATLDNLAPGAFTLCCWMYVDIANQLQIICTKMTADLPPGWAFMIHSNNNWAYDEGRATTNRVRISNTNTLTTSTWTFVALTVASSLNASDVHFYKGEGLTALAEVSGYGTSTDAVGAYNTDAATSLVVGNNNAGTIPFLGRVCELRLFNSVLSLTELEGIRSRSAGIDKTSQLNAPYWGFSPEPDLSGNANNGTLTGTTVVGHAPVGRLVPYRVRMPLGGQTATAVDVESVSSTKNILRWTDSSGGVHTNIVQRSTDNTVWSDLATVAAGTTTYTDSTPSSKTRYYYRVKTNN